MFYIHGGGFSSGSAKERRDITTYLASEYGFTVYANDYRLAPQVGLPEMQEDCLNFYLGILESGVNPERCRHCVRELLQSPPKREGGAVLIEVRRTALAWNLRSAVYRTSILITIHSSFIINNRVFMGKWQLQYM